jgi:hypothetical protein
VAYRDEPYRVYFHWEKPSNYDLWSALYCAGENNGKIKVCVRLGRFKLDKAPDGDEARKQSRYPMDTFGLRQAMQRVLDTWKAAQADNALHVEYEGTVKLDGRLCYKFHRTRYARPEGDDGVAELVIFIDCESLLQVGSIVRGRDGIKLGEYYFQQIELNPEIPAWQFTPEAFGKDKK